MAQCTWHCATSSSHGIPWPWLRKRAWTRVTRWVVSAGYVATLYAVQLSPIHQWLPLAVTSPELYIQLWLNIFSLSLSTDCPLCLCPLCNQWSCRVSMDRLAHGKLCAGSPGSALHLHKKERQLLRLVPWSHRTKKRVHGHRRSINLQSPDFREPPSPTLRKSL